MYNQAMEDEIEQWKEKNNRMENDTKQEKMYAWVLDSPEIRNLENFVIRSCELSTLGIFFSIISTYKQKQSILVITFVFI